MLNQMLVFLLDTFLGLFALALLLRFWLQTLRAPLRNPIYPFLSALTDWLVLPARRLIPGLWGIDLSTLVLAWLTELVLELTTLPLRGYSVGPALGADLAQILLLAAVAVARLSLYIVMVSVIVQVVMSWVAPHSPAMPLAKNLTRPFLRPFQKRVPPIGNIDISPLLLLVVIQLLLYLLEWLRLALERGIAAG
jgi:YggT family protein